jgi:aspartyl/asparaginyl beta-hydroxylase (cupin superfamily)
MSLTGKKGKLGRVYIAKMIPGGSIYPHKDPCKYFELHDRYHIVLQTNDGVSFSCGDDEATTETVRFDTGELWVFSNKVTHWAQNNGDTDRIHIIIDIQHDDPYYKTN